MIALVTVAAMLTAPTPVPVAELAARPRPATTYSSRSRRRALRQLSAARWYLRRHRATRPHRAWLRRLRACEATGNYRAVDPSGTYRGAYQFDRPTWASVGGWGDPAAAPPLEQDYRAVVLLRRRGVAPWPVCG